MKFEWFGRKSRPVQTRAPAAWLSGWAASEAPRGYEALVRSAYMVNSIAQRAVRIVAEGAAGAPVLANPAGHPALKLLGGGTSGDSRTGPALVETIAANLLLHGNAFVEVGLGPDGMPAALYALRPERITVEADSAGWPVGFLYRAGDNITRYPAMTVGERAGLLHIRSFHPLDDHYGLGCLGAAAGAVDTHNAASRWNKALLDNAARPSGALVYAPGDGSTLSPEGFDRLKAEMEAGYAGAANAGRPMLLEGGLSWQAMSLTPAEMDFGRARDTASREIALAFGVPPMLLGLPGYNSYGPAFRIRSAGRRYGTFVPVSYQSPQRCGPFFCHHCSRRARIAATGAGAITSAAICRWRHSGKLDPPQPRRLWLDRQHRRATCRRFGAVPCRSLA